MAAVPASDRPYTTRAQRALRLADGAAAALGDPYIGTEHLLLGLLDDPICPAAQLLSVFGVSAETARKEWDRLRKAPPQ